MGHLGDRFQHFRNDAMLVYESTRWMTPTAIILHPLAVRVFFGGLHGYAVGGVFCWPWGLGTSFLGGSLALLGRMALRGDGWDNNGG